MHILCSRFVANVASAAWVAPALRLASTRGQIRPSSNSRFVPLMRRLLLTFGAGLGLFLALPHAALACPLCGSPTLTLSEQFGNADVVLEARWLAGTEAEVGQSSTRFEIAQVLRGSPTRWKAGDGLSLTRFHSGMPGQSFLLFGAASREPEGKDLDWAEPLPATVRVVDYIRNAPAGSITGAERLAYFVRFLEDSELTIANDAYGEFANAPYEAVVPIARKMSRETLRGWLSSPDTTPTRKGLYGMMLGLCGNAADAAHLKKLITAPADEPRLGVNGMIAGYLLLTGDAGLPLIADSMLKNEASHDTFAAIEALRFLGTYGGDRISRSALQVAMRCVLDRPAYAELALTDLTRWKDWSILNQLIELYRRPGQEDRLKWSILGYMTMASRDGAAGPGKPKPSHVTDATAFLRQVRQDDPKTVREFELRYKP